MPRHAQLKLDHTTLEMAVRGYEAERARITAAITEIRAQLGQRGSGLTAPTRGTDHSTPKKRTMSASARARIAAAQRARWQAYKKANAEPKQAHMEKPKKRRLSAAGRRAIQLATKKRWAAYHKAQKPAPKAKAKPRAAAGKAAAPETMTASI